MGGGGEREREREREDVIDICRYTRSDAIMDGPAVQPQGSAWSDAATAGAILVRREGREREWGGKKKVLKPLLS